MAGSKEFIEEFGSLSFDQFPFCDGDAVSFCEAFYMPFEKVVTDSFDDDPTDFLSASNLLFAKKEFKHSGLGLMITSKPSQRMVAISGKERYRKLKIFAVRELYSKIPAIQFAAGTFILPDGTPVVVFRGTDDTISGWREDFDILVRKGTPAYNIALDYIEKVAEKFKGNIIICGHSKGGNIALYTALKCAPKIRKRISALYNFDGPGFHNYDIFKTGAYDEIKPVYKHYIPSDAFVGVIMAHDYDYKVVKSTMPLGPLQHDLGSWYIEGGNLVTVKDTDALSKFYDVVFAKLAGNCEKRGFSDVVAKVFESVSVGTGQKDLTGLAKNLPSSIKGAKEAWKNLDPQTQEDFKIAFSGMGQYVKDGARAVRENQTEESARFSFDTNEDLIK